MTTTQSHLWIQCNPYQHFNGSFHRNRTKKNPKIYMEQQNAPNSQINPEIEEQSGRHHNT